MSKNRKKRSGMMFVSSLLILSEIMSFAGCKSNSREEVRKVSKDSLWFNTTTTRFEDKYKSMKLEYYETNLLGAYKDGIVFRVDGDYRLPDDFDWEKDNLEDYSFTNLDYYTFKGELINSVDVSKEVSAENNTRLYDIISNGDDISLKILDMSNGKPEFFFADVDLEKGIIGEFEESGNNTSDLSQTDNMYFHGTWIIGDYSLSRYGSGNSFSFIIEKGGSSKFVNLASDPHFSNILYISGYIIVSETEILLICLSNNVTLLSLNLETGEIKDKDEEYPWLSSVNYFSHTLSADGKTYVADQSGIKIINFESKQLDEILSFNCCNINRYTMSDMDLLSVEDGRYVFGEILGDEDSLAMDYMGNRGVPTVVVLEKSDSNPNEGKIILSAASAGQILLMYPVCEAIRVFNDNSDKYYIQLDNKLKITDYIDYSNAESNDEQRGIYYNGASALSNQLATDMISGEGPDIILNAGDFSQIQSEDYLLDLNQYIKGKNGINESDYFSNVMDAAKTGDKLFYMPISFTVSGIPAKKSDVRDGQTGFTFDEYIKFKDDVCNGSDPMYETRLGVLSILYSYMSNTCINGNEVNFDNESFKALCDYVKHNVTDDSYREDQGDEPGYYSCIADFFRVYGAKASDMTLLGYPSTDGRGTVITINTSIGISSSVQPAVADGAWEFIKTCLNDELQDSVVRYYDNPMSVRVYESTAAIALENYNKANPLKKIDESAITSYREVLAAAAVIDNSDPAILVVLREEVPPYFLDQKSFDAVLKIIQDRVSTIIAERT